MTVLPMCSTFKMLARGRRVLKLHAECNRANERLESGGSGSEASDIVA